MVRLGASRRRFCLPLLVAFSPWLGSVALWVVTGDSDTKRLSVPDQCLVTVGPGTTADCGLGLLGTVRTSLLLLGLARGRGGLC